MNSREYQNSHSRRSNEFSRRRWEQSQRTNQNSRRSRLEEKRFNYKHSKYNSKSPNKNNHQRSGNSSDVQRKQQQQRTISPVGANDTVTSHDCDRTGETILINSHMKDGIETSTSSTFLNSTVYDQNISNKCSNLNKSQERLNGTPSLQPTNLDQNQDLKKLAISKLLNDVCNEPETNVSNIASKFFQAMVTELLSLTDSLPEQRSFIYNILSALVDLGMKCAQKEPNQEYTLDPQVSENNCSENDNFKDLRSLINVDCRIQSLLKERVDLYGKVYNLMRRLEKNPNELNNVEDTRIQNSIGSVKNEIAAVTESFNNLQNNMSINILNINPNVCNDNQVIPSTSQCENQEMTSRQRNSIQSSSNNELCNENSSGITGNEEVTHSFGSIQSTELQCFCLHDQVLIGGYKNGSVLIFCSEKRTLLDNVQPHKKPVTSITVKENILLTTSLDGIMRKYDLKNHTVKKLNLEHGIYTSFLYNDIIYLGTNSGHIIRVLVKDFKQLSIPFCVSHETVLSIKVTEERNALLMFILAKGSSVCIRDGLTGSLLHIFQNFQNASDIILLNHPLRLCAAFDDKILIRDVHQATSLLMKPHCVTCMILHRGVLFIASKVNKIFIYDEKTVSELFVMSDVPKNIIGMSVSLDSLIIASTRGFNYLKIPKLVLGSFGEF